MNEYEKTFEKMEDEVPALCVEASRRAFRRSLAAGLTVLASGVDEYGNDVLYEISPDGSRRFVKMLEPSTQVEVGRRLVIP